MALRLLVAEDHTLVRQGLVRLLQDEEDIQVVGEASNGFEALAMARELKPDAVLMDLYMPCLDGVAATRLIKQEMPDVQVVLLTISTEEDDLFEAVQAGARGYVLKSVNASNLVKQLRQVMSGGVALSEDMTNKLVTGLARKVHISHNDEPVQCEVLTEREKEVLALISRGATNKEIASTLVISENTVRSHVRSLMQKLHLDNRTQLAVYGVREGFALDSRNSYPTNVTAASEAR